MIPHSHAATTYAPKRGRIATSSAATISTTPTTCIVACGAKGDKRAIPGAKFSQWVNGLVNLSAPARSGAATKPQCSISNAW